MMIARLHTTDLERINFKAWMNWTGRSGFSQEIVEKTFIGVGWNITRC